MLRCSIKVTKPRYSDQVGVLKGLCCDRLRGVLIMLCELCYVELCWFAHVVHIYEYEYSFIKVSLLASLQKICKIDISCTMLKLNFL